MKVYITKKVEFATAHRLKDDKGKCKNIHGHNFEAEVTVSGEPDSTGWIMPFKDLKNSIWGITKNIFDHKTLLDTEDTFAILPFQNGGLDFVEVPVPPTTESIAAMIFYYVKHSIAQTNPSVTVEKVVVHEDCWQKAIILNNDSIGNTWFSQIDKWAKNILTLQSKNEL